MNRKRKCLACELRAAYLRARLYRLQGKDADTSATLLSSIYGHGYFAHEGAIYRSSEGPGYSPRLILKTIDVAE